ncbi:MAG: helicase-associated domain-containing protein [Chloroflexi bacterium]|nr:helicase-associated domain-containing protein [Chloroflexota bacterium]
MPDLISSLFKQDIGHLRIVAGLWGIELESTDTDLAAKELAASLLDLETAAELIDSLAPEARAALTALTDSGGRIPWAVFARQFGGVREMGAGKRDRERPHLKPASIAEVLFYRALLASAFFDTDKGPQEFAYIPDDLFLLLNREERKRREGEKKKNLAPLAGLAVNSDLPGREAALNEKAHMLSADDRVLDDATTLLAALRVGRADYQPYPRLQTLLTAAKLSKKNIPQTEEVKAFLEASRTDALEMLVTAWRKSEAFNELRLMPGIVCEGEWKNSPLDTRNSILGFLETIPKDKWWSLNSFVNAIKQKRPDFQRPAGDYDSWFIKRASDGKFLRGFESWDEVDGALICFFITDILHWLGMADLASAKPDGDITAFRLTISESRMSNIENGKLKIASNGKIAVPRLVPRVVRYQLARFCEWGEAKPGEYHYHITPHSLTKAKEQGLKVEHLLALLAKHSDAGIPPVLVKALKRWEVNGTEARAETQIVLKVSRPEVLEELRRSKAARFLGEPLGPTTVIVKGGAIQKVMDALTELGLLAEDLTEEK